MEVCDSFEVWGRIIFFFWGGGGGWSSKLRRGSHCRAYGKVERFLASLFTFRLE